MDEARLKRALDTLLAEPQEHPEPGSGTLLVAYRLRDMPAIPSSVPCHILRTTYDAEHPAHLLLDRRPRPDDIMVYAFIGKRQLDRVLMALAPSSSNFFQVLVDNLGQEQQSTTVITESGEVDPAMLQDIFSLMVVAYAERREEWELAIDGLASAAIALASPAISHQPGRRSPDDLVALLLTEIATHPESVTLQGLAERFSYNPTYLSGLLHERCGRTFSHLVREQRMLRAHQLLTDTGLSVAKVAAMVGYEGTSNFHRLFRERFGETPAQVRAGRSTHGAAMMEAQAHDDQLQEAHDGQG
ncbi:helix-turn-helix transcriptional regulator [Olsenella sp. kh2p3]|jgi:AraC-like DNA-binding protein|uniref:helix-turn-helix transcriptional regulator n=1 Tax=Olsenella sp. kh2p3 TaxID=1797112 RepID=UPI00091A6C22|nr:helix-turn-helix transcriptional regulator [Olsenella sp. kh2p3]SFX57129.1 Helix-turn-helix domain-containing protein [Olsenella sp. kh2p3]